MASPVALRDSTFDSAHARCGMTETLEVLFLPTRGILEVVARECIGVHLLIGL